MAEFETESTEGMHWVKVTLNDDSIRAEKGALNHYKGSISMTTPLPSLRNMWISLFSEESLYRPRYKGTGEVYLDSSLGGFHIVAIHQDETWILDNGAYWASDDEIEISVRRERFGTAFWAGEGFFWYQTQVRGEGKIVLAATGPVEEITLNDERLVVDGRMVIARTGGIDYTIRRPTHSLFSYLLSGQKIAHVYQGTGRLLISTTPYWRFAMKSRRAAQDLALMD